LTEGEVAGFFGARAAKYDGAYDARSADGHALRARLKATVELLGEGPGDVLDVGMGPGRLCAELERRGWTVYGVDSSEEMVEFARRRLPAASDRLQRAEIERLPFPDERFDAVAATGVLEYADLRCALDEVARVLRPEGRAVLSYPNPQALYGIWKTRAFYPAVRIAKRALRRGHRMLPRGAGPIRPDRFEELLSAAGLEPRARVLTSFLPIPTPLDSLWPSIAAAAGERLEQGGPRAGRWLATQIVFAAERAAEPSALLYERGAGPLPRG
jgi:ubiquinone/menaquinone biosynthesis C-methylase UbiE